MIQLNTGVKKTQKKGERGKVRALDENTLQPDDLQDDLRALFDADSRGPSSSLSYGSGLTFPGFTCPEYHSDVQLDPSLDPAMLPPSASVEMPLPFGDLSNGYWYS